MSVEEALFRHVVEGAGWSPFTEVVLGVSGSPAGGGPAVPSYHAVSFERVGDRVWASAAPVDFRSGLHGWGVIDGIYLGGVTAGGIVVFARKQLRRPYDALGVSGPYIRKGVVRVTFPRHLGAAFVEGLGQLLFEGASEMTTIDRGSLRVGVRGTDWKVAVTLVYEKGYGRNVEYIEFPEVESEGAVKAGTHLVVYDGPAGRVIGEAPLNKPVSLRTGSSVVVPPGCFVLRFL